MQYFCKSLSEFCSPFADSETIRPEKKCLGSGHRAGRFDANKKSGPQYIKRHRLHLSIIDRQQRF